MMRPFHMAVPACLQLPILGSKVNHNIHKLNIQLLDCAYCEVSIQVWKDVEVGFERFILDVCVVKPGKIFQKQNS